MDYLWTPWRYKYVTSNNRSAPNPLEEAPEAAPRCVFCHIPEATEAEERRRGLVFRGKYCFICLNAFPYTAGHVMVVPYQHLDELQKLPAEAAFEMIALGQRLEGVLRQLYEPDGLNLGMNLGEAAGAGVAGHIHLHVLPRWIGDGNFLSVVGETRVLPETLDITWQRLRDALGASK